MDFHLLKKCTTVDLQSNGAFKDIFAILNDNLPKTVPYIRSGSVGNFFIDNKNLSLISDEAHEQLDKTITRTGDILMARKGKIGGASIVYDENANQNTNDNVVNIRIIDNQELIPQYLTTFLNCKYGLDQVFRVATGNVQPWLSMHQVRNLTIMVPDYAFQEEVKVLVDKAYYYQKKSKDLLYEAETAFLNDLELLNYSENETLSNVINFSFVKKSLRLDAEYYHPKYLEVIEKIKERDYSFLSDIVDFRKGTEVGSSSYSVDGIPFIRISNLSPEGLSEEKYISEEEYFKLLAHQPLKDEILLSKDGSPGIAYHIHSEPDKMIVSGGVMILNIKRDDISPEYLSLVLNSLTTERQVTRDVGGSIIKHWRPDQIKKLLVPIIDETIRNEIDHKKQLSLKYCELSNEFIRVSKKVCELQIESGENTALNWLEKELCSLEENYNEIL
jgi:restriction endonuclease S subunit